MSRTCVREAFKSLEMLQLITVRPKIGAVVLEPSSVALINAEHLSASAYMQHTDVLVEFRKILEVGLASLAAEKRTEEDLVIIRQALTDFERAVKTDRVAHYADVAFHKAIADATKNPLATLVLKTISEVLIERSRHMNQIPGVLEEGLRQHRKIYLAIKEQNAENARKAMRMHMLTVERNTQVLRAAEELNENAAIPRA